MKKRLLYILPVVGCLASGAASANWQYPGTYVGDGWYSDDGSQFVISVRGGASYSFASIKNDIGALTPGFWYNPSNDDLRTGSVCGDYGENCPGFEFAGYVDLGKVPVVDDYSEFTVAGGASLGWTLPNHPQWRLEAGWDHIAKTQYNASPFIEGETAFFGGDFTSGIIASGAVHSDITTDIFSVMAFYDFFDGLQKPTQKMIPYVGFGIGYADTKTVLNLSDPYGDLSDIYELLPYGDRDDNNIAQFYKSETSNSNFAGLLALGISYGITDRTYLDFGARVMYIPKIKWELSNEDDTKHREWFSAENLIYTNLMVGVRFEF